MNATPNFPQIPALPTSFHREEWKESALRNLILTMNHLIKARKFVPDVTISLKLFETKLFFGFCHRSHLQLHHQAFLFSSTLLRAKAHCEKTASVSHLSYHDGALILHSWEQTFIYNHKPTDTHSFAAQQCSNMRDGHLSGVFHIYSHIFNLLFDFAK